MRGILEQNGTPEVSVVLAIHDPGPYLRETLESVLGQQGVDLELLVVDDGCTDGSPELLAELAATDPRLRVLRQPHRGLTQALVYGCREARGPYIARQDAGDVSLPGRFAAQKAALDKENGLAFVSCWTEFCGPEYEFLHLAKASCPSPASIFDPQVPGAVVTGPTCHASVMFRKTAYERAGGYRPAFYFSQDWDLWFRLAEIGTFQVIDECLYRFRVLPSGISADKPLQERYGTLARRALEARQRGESDTEALAAASALASTPRLAVTRRHAAVNYYLGASLARHGHPSALKYAARAVRHNPLSPRSWALLAWAGLLRMIPPGFGRRRVRESAPLP